MKKQFLVLSLLFIIVLTGCSRNPYEAFKNAVETTGNTETGKTFTNVKIYSVLKPNEVFPSEIAVSVLDTYSDYGKKGITDIHVFSGTLGYDVKFYRESSNEGVLKMPHLPDYYKVEMPMVAPTSDEEDLAKKVQDKWMETIQSENVFAMDDALIETENGDVKAKTYSIRPSSEQIRTFKSWLSDEINSHKSEFELSIPALGEVDLKAIFDSVEITALNGTVYVDFDGYLIEEKLEMTIQYLDESLPFTEQSIEISTDYTALNKKVTLDFTPIKDGNIKSIDSLKTIE